MGLGHRTGIDTPGEFGGTVPDRAWRDRLNARGGGLPQAQAPPVRHRRRHQPPVDRGRRGQPRRRPGRPAGHAAADGGGLLGRWPTATTACARTSAPPWRTPAAGCCSASSPAPPQHVTIDPAVARRRSSTACTTPPSTAPRPTCGRAGTRAATRCSARPAPPSALNRPNDQSWYVCFVNDPQRPIVVAVTVEDGGFGADAAAPVARTIVSKWFHQPIKYIAGKSKTF